MEMSGLACKHVGTNNSSMLLAGYVIYNTPLFGMNIPTFIYAIVVTVTTYFFFLIFPTLTLCCPGNNIAQLDPLGINDADLDSAIPPELQMGENMDQNQVG